MPSRFFRSLLSLSLMLGLLVLPEMSLRTAVAEDEAKSGEKQTSSKQQSPAKLAVFKLRGPITDKPVAEDFPFGPVQSESLRSLVGRLDKAAEDDAISGVVILLSDVQFGYAQAEEIRAAIERLQEAEKPVYAHVDSLSMANYLLVCGVDRLSVVPTGDLWITGLSGAQLYVRGLLDKIGVRPDFLTMGDYKSAAEMFTRTEPSEAAAEMYDWLFDSMFDSVIEMVAEGREVEEDEAEAWIDHGLYSAEEAAEEGIIDAVETRSQFEQHLREEHGEKLAFERKYGKKKGPQIDFNNPFAALQLWAQLLAGPQTRRSRGPAVAVVHVDGAIMPGDPAITPFGTVDGAYSEPLRKALQQVAEDDTVKAVVLRVNSPGGSAVASEIILQASQEVANEKPLVASMGDVAGSGGYYVTCAAERIFADSMTITGSIGVVAGKLATGQMWDKIGINFKPIERGENAGILSSDDVFSDEEREQLRDWMERVYEVFKDHVVESRGEKLSKPIDELAGGRVFTGAQAVELGLVDELGGLQQAIEYAAEQAGLDEYEVREVPRPKGFFELLMGDLSGQNSDDEKHLDVAPAPSAHGVLRAALPYLQHLDPQRVGSVRAAMMQLDVLQRETLSLTMPILQVR